MKRNWLNSFWSKGRKKIEEDRSRCLGDLKKNQRMGSHRCFLSLALRFRNSKFPVKLNWATIEFPIIFNLGFSDLEKIACILRRLYIFSLCSFTFVCFFNRTVFIFSCSTYAEFAMCIFICKNQGWRQDGCSSSKVSLFEPSNESLEDVKTTLDLQIGNVSIGTVLVISCDK